MIAAGRFLVRPGGRDGAEQGVAGADFSGSAEIDFEAGGLVTL